MSIDMYYIFLAIFILSNAIVTVNSISVGEDSLLLPLSSFSHFCNNGYASIQNKLDILKNTRKTANSNSNDATMSTIPQQQYDVTRRQLEEEGRLERALKNWPSSQQQLEAQSSYENAINSYQIESASRARGTAVQLYRGMGGDGTIADAAFYSIL